MAKTKDAYRCVECGWTTLKWAGRCGECQAWGTVTESAASAAPRTRSRSVTSERLARPIGEVDASRSATRATGVGEFDRALGGGLVPGGVVLVAGEPGIGKSTLLLDVAARVAWQGATVLYVTGEESAAQVRLRAERIEAMAASLYLAAESDLASVLGQIEALSPELVIVDSVQTIASAEVEGTAGNVTQVREVTSALIASAKERDAAMLLVGHVTKDGSIAGPRVLEHLVDVVMQFEGERQTALRMLRAVKNRYGATDEVGCFELGEGGITGLPDPSGLFLSHRTEGTDGTCVTVTLEGRRPLVVEVQALVGTSVPSPRRVTHGIDNSRSAMVAAVTTRRVKGLAGRDLYLSTVGGARATEPSVDLALAVAMASSVLQRPVRQGLIILGEVGLSGEVRRVPGVARRLAEAARLGFREALVPTGALTGCPAPSGMSVQEVLGLDEALHAALTSV